MITVFNEQIAITVTFQPATEGIANASVVINTNGGIATIDLTGIAEERPLSFEWDFQQAGFRKKRKVYGNRRRRKSIFFKATFNYEDTDLNVSVYFTDVSFCRLPTRRPQ